MAKSAKAVMIIQARQQVMRSLDLVYPSGLTMKALYQTVCAINEMYDFKLLQRDVAYLKGKGYVFFVDDLIGGMADIEAKVVKLTPKGLEISQDVIDDPALELFNG